jgi:hypothetical protein
MSNLQKEQTLGKYTIVNELGRGGFATVYLARDSVLRRSVALKVLHPVLLTDPAFVSRFESEARAIAQFDHPHIATIYELGHYEGRLCIAIQLLPGGTLADRIRDRGPLSFAETVRAIGHVAEALDHAHAAGFTHRDIKPSNILFNARDDAVLTDFGLVKAAEGSVIARSTMGSLLGTPPYMAPEVWEGKGDSPRTDVYALGCVLFEMITGELLFRGETPPAVMLTHFQAHKYPEQWPDGTPNNIAVLLERALAREPADRYASAGALATDLRALAERPADPFAESYQALRAALAARQWARAEELARQIGAQEPNYRDLRELARQAAEGKAQEEQERSIAQWREQALVAEREGRIAEAQDAAQRWLAAAPADAQAQALAQRLARAVAQAQPKPQAPATEERRGQATSGGALAQPMLQDPAVGSRRGQVTSGGAQAQPVHQTPAVVGRRGQVTSGSSGKAPAQSAQQAPGNESQRGQIMSGNSGQTPAQPVRQATILVGRRGQVTSRMNEQEQAQPQPQISRTGVLTDIVLVPTMSSLISFLMISVGCALGSTISYLMAPDVGYNWPLAWITGSGPVGAIIGYALHRIEPALHWKHVLLITISWLGGALVSNIGLGVLIGCISGALFTTLILGWAQPTLQWKQLLAMIIGWAGGCGIGLAIAIFVSNGDVGGSYSTRDIIAFGLLGACFGAGGAATTIWQLYQVRRSAETGMR